jgi:threonine/homoserine/homoserine lactone efflux protein
VIGVAAAMMQYPALFLLLKYLGGLYLCFLGGQLWFSRGKLALTAGSGIQVPSTPGALALQGFVTAVANPKGWAFFIALLPPFIDRQQPLAAQMALLLGLILMIEFLCLILYAGGGHTLNRLLQRNNNLRLLNHIAGTLMVGVGVWLALG